MDSKSDSSSCRTSFISSCSQSSDTPFVTALLVESYSPPKSNVMAAELHPPASCGGNDIELSESSFDSNVLENIDVTDQLVFRKPVSLNCIVSRNALAHPITCCCVSRTVPRCDIGWMMVFSLYWTVPLTVSVFLWLPAMSQFQESVLLSCLQRAVMDLCETCEERALWLGVLHSSNF